jgi:hypothetical protein
MLVNQFSHHAAPLACELSAGGLQYEFSHNYSTSLWAYYQLAQNKGRIRAVALEHKSGERV